MLRKLRIALAAIFFVGLVLLFVGVCTDWLGWMASLQFLPSLLAGNLVVIIGVLLLTIVLGRLYCSVICPMGVTQDIIIFLRRQYGKMMTRCQAKRLQKLKAAGKELPKPRNYAKKFSYSTPNRLFRYGFLFLLVASFIFFGQLLVSLFAPYSAWGRIVRSIIGLAQGESIAPALLITTAVTLVLVVTVAWTWGRQAVCNTICPVGFILGCFSRYAMFRPVIDKSKCVSCKKCGQGCKASCIDMDAHSIDYSRCVVCFDCINTCQEGAIKYVWAWGKKNESTQKENSAPADGSRRTFIATSVVALGAASGVANAQNKRLDGALADVVDKQSPERNERLVPFGAGSVDNFYSSCTACQLCVSNCPNNVLRPSTDIEHFLQPVMGYEKGYCRPECTTCSEVCPAGAIKLIDKAEKLVTKIGTAKVNLELCFASTGEASCGNCSRHCPVGAVRMVKSEGYNFAIPVVNEAQCIGCGACEFLCPSRPISAITVDGVRQHSKTIN